MSTVSKTSGWDDRNRATVARSMTTNDVNDAVRAGVEDFSEKPSHYVFLGLLYPIIGVGIGLVTAGMNAIPLIWPLVAGFALVGPLAAVLFCEMSRRREAGLPLSWKQAFGDLRSNHMGPMIRFGLILLAVFVAWLFTAQVIYDRLYVGENQAGIVPFLATIFGTTRGILLLMLGNFFGMVFALIVLAIGSVTVPMIIDRGASVREAMGMSIRVFGSHPVPTLYWGLIIGVSLFVGSLILFVGLAVALPVLGHASWHFYRRAVA